MQRQYSEAGSVVNAALRRGRQLTQKSRKLMQNITDSLDLLAEVYHNTQRRKDAANRRDESL